MNNFINSRISIMETMLIELTNEKAAKLLYELEELHLIKVLQKSRQAKEKLSTKYAGSLPGDVADEIQNYVAESRGEWDSSAI